MTEKLINPVHKDYMQTLKCDCCGKEIFSLRFPVCVMNPCEVLCMECFRADHRHNARVIKENANNYRLQSELESVRERMVNYHGQIDNLMIKNHEINMAMKENNQKTHKLIDDAYKCAIATDSASAIEILRNLKEEFDKESD